VLYFTDKCATKQIHMLVGVQVFIKIDSHSQYFI